MSCLWLERVFALSFQEELFEKASNCLALLSIPKMALSFKDIHAAGRSFGCKGILKIATESISW